ncbi:MAG: DUF4870 domain-containing protein [Nocardioidaceae bacterium]
MSYPPTPERPKPPQHNPQQGSPLPQPPGYGTPNQGHPQPQQGYDAPNQGYPQPQQGYDAPNQGHPPPQQGYGLPNQGYPDQPSYLTSETKTASASSSDDRTWALASHIGALVAAWFAMGFIAPLVVLLVKGERSEFVKRHATESLNFQLSLLLYSLVAVLVAVFTLGVGLLVVIPVALVVMVLSLVAIIMGTMAASRGDDFRYPLSIRFIS